jgi:hypothetical protein
MRYQSPTQLACGSKEFYPPFPFPPGESAVGDGSPHGANYAPPPARGISKRSAEIPLARSPCRARGCIEKVEVLAGMPAGTVKHHLVLGMVPLAGFEVITDGRF